MTVDTTSRGSFKKTLKHSLITPIIKKPSLDPSSFNNYRPISNLSILSKTLERVVSKQLSSFLTTNNILCTFQSAYVPNKSTETAITRVTTNILCDLNNTYGTILVLLDLSAAFDTIDHSLLISRLANICITGLHLNGLRYTFLIVLLLFLSMGTYHLLEIFLTESPKALY